MEKFYIVPKEQEFEIDGTNKEEAIVNFAFNMDMDMNNYFVVLSESEYKKYKEEHVED